MAGLYWLSSQSRLCAPGGFEIPDKVAHAAAYFGLCLIARFPAGTLFRSRGMAILFAFLVAASYGVLDEFHQSLTPNRAPDINDWFADAGGALVAGVLLFWAERKFRGSEAKARGAV